jgi:glycosyltransferase involved in cell wall biosynthesis
MLRPSDIHVAVVSQNAEIARDMRPRSVAAALADAGYRVSLVGPTRQPDAAAGLPGGIDVRTFALPMPARGAAGQVREQATAMVRALATLLSIAKECRIDVLHIGNPPDNGWLFPHVLRLAQRPMPIFVFDQHDPTPLLVGDKFGDSPPMKLATALLQRLEGWAFRSATLVVFANDPFLDRARRARLLMSESLVAPNGWELPDDPPCSVPWEGAGKPLVAYLGTINTQDCVEHLVRAVAALAVRPQVVVAGDGDALPRARALAASLGVAEDFAWLGWVEDRRVLGRLVRHAAVCVAPETSSPANDVTSFVKVIEYMSAGSPVVAHRLPQTEALAGDAVEYARDMSPKALAEAITRVLEDRSLAASMAAGSRARFEEWLRWDTVGAPRLLEAYERVIVPAVASRRGPSRAGAGAAETHGLELGRG